MKDEVSRGGEEVEPILPLRWRPTVSVCVSIQDVNKDKDIDIGILLVTKREARLRTRSTHSGRQTLELQEEGATALTL